MPHSTLQNLNYMKRLLHHPCATPPLSVIIQTAFDAGIPILFELWDFSLWDVAAALYHKNIKPPTRPRGPEFGGKHGRKIKAYPGSIGNPLGGSTDWWLFNFLAPIETLRFYMFAANLGTEFISNWATLMYEKQGCDGTNCYARVPLTVPRIVQPGETYHALLGSAGALPGVAWGGRDIAVTGQTRVTVSYQVDAVTWDVIPDPPAEFTTELVSTNLPVMTPSAMKTDGGAVPITAPGGYSDPRTPSGHDMQLHITSTQGYTAVVGGHIDISVGRCAVMGPEMPARFRQLL